MIYITLVYRHGILNPRVEGSSCHARHCSDRFETFENDGERQNRLRKYCFSLSLILDSLLHFLDWEARVKFLG
jgi:hypothetical protein